MTPNRPTTPMTEPSNEQINTGASSPAVAAHAAAAAREGQEATTAAGHTPPNFPPASTPPAEPRSRAIPSATRPCLQT